MSGKLKKPFFLCSYFVFPTSRTMFNSLCLYMTQWNSMENAAELQSTYVATSIVNGLCSIIAVTCNLAVILVIVRNSSLHTPSYVLLCNLAISDLGVGFVAQPLYIALIIAQLKEEAHLSCKIGAVCLLIGICLAFLSFFTVTIISVDRFLAVYLANKYRSTVTIKSAKMVVVSLWLIAVTVVILFLLNTTVYYMIAMIVMSCCLLFTSCNYIAIGRLLQRRHARTQAHNHIQTGEQRNIFNIGQYKKTLTTMLYVYGAFLLCYLPYLCFTITRISFGRTSTLQRVYYIIITISFLNSALNPFLYYWRIPKVRLRIKQLFDRGTTGKKSTRVTKHN